MEPDAVPTVFEDYPTHLVPKKAVKRKVGNIRDQEPAPKRNVELADPELYDGETPVNSHCIALGGASEELQRSDSEQTPCCRTSAQRRSDTAVAVPK
ncbi:hypothetical protein MTO96_030622 [Rhipicephalus appendiculatus]